MQQIIIILALVSYERKVLKRQYSFYKLKPEHSRPVRRQRIGDGVRLAVAFALSGLVGDAFGKQSFLGV